MKRIACIIFLFCITLLSACKKDDTVPDPGTNPGDNPDTEELTDEKRLEILKSVESTFATLNWDNRNSAHEQMLTFLQSIPQFEEAGISPDQGNVWARFTDGELLLIANNRKPTDNTNPDELRTGAISERNARAGVPGSSTAVLMNAMGNYYVNGQTDLRTLGYIFGNKGYQVSKMQGSIENLKKVKNEGVFYFSSHGGLGKLRDNTQVYGLWTTDSATVENNKTFRQELKKGSLCYFLAHHNKDRYGKPVPEMHYGVTTKFVEEHMSFAENALVYIDACSSFTDTDFVWSFLKKSNHTGVYFGWTGAVGDEVAHKTCKHFFDRVLGANDIYSQPETPNQRPFDYELVFAEMVKKDIGVYNDPERPGQTATLTYKASPDQMTLLRPTIAYVQVDEVTGKLYIIGTFGDDPGAAERTVTVNNTPVEIEEWGYGLITCKIPVSGPGSAGDVLVKIREHTSNARTLTEWRGELLFNHPGAGTLARTITFKIHLRADVHHYRSVPGEQPKPYYEAYQLVSRNSLAKDSEVSYSIGGQGVSQYQEGCSSTMTVTWDSRQSTIPWTQTNIDPVSLGKFFQTNVKLDKKGFTLNINVEDLKATKMLRKIVDVCPNGTHTGTDPITDITLGGLPTQFREIILSLDSQSNIQAGQKEIRLGGYDGLLYNAGQVPTYPVTFKWAKIQANFAPKANAAVRIGFE